MKLKRFSGVIIIALFLCASWIHSGESGSYVGKEKCAMCHPAIHETWQSTRHAKAIESLKKSGQEVVPDCARCHVTGNGKDSGFIDYELTPEMAGVQCEVCHGPGGKHITDMTKKTINREPGETLCRECHTKGQDPGFDYKEKVKSAHGKK